MVVVIEEADAAVFFAVSSGCPVCFAPVYETERNPAEVDEDKVATTLFAPVDGAVKRYM